MAIMFIPCLHTMEALSVAVAGMKRSKSKLVNTVKTALYNLVNHQKN
jgi:hypothetical protein